MIDIPRKMTNEESILFATIITDDREAAILRAKRSAMMNRIEQIKDRLHSIAISRTGAIADLIERGIVVTTRIK